MCVGEGILSSSSFRTFYMLCWLVSDVSGCLSVVGCVVCGVVFAAAAAAVGIAGGVGTCPLLQCRFSSPRRVREGGCRVGR